MTAPMDAKLCRAPNPLMAVKSIRAYLEQDRLSDAVAALKEYGEQYAAYALAEVERTRTPPATPSPEVDEIEGAVSQRLEQMQAQIDEGGNLNLDQELLNTIRQLLYQNSKLQARINHNALVKNTAIREPDRTLPSPEVDSTKLVRKMLDACDGLEDLADCMSAALHAIRPYLAQAAAPEVNHQSLKLESDEKMISQWGKPCEGFYCGCLGCQSEGKRQKLAPQGDVRVSVEECALEAWKSGYGINSWNVAQEKLFTLYAKAVIYALKNQNPEVTFHED